MVWRRMGLLDDAIREHLELKRLRGADQGDVARAEREALGEPAHEIEAGPDESEGADIRAREEHHPRDAETHPGGGGEADPGGTETHPSGGWEAFAGVAHPSGRPAGETHPVDRDMEETGSETIELDMEPLLDDERSGPSRPPATDAGASSVYGDYEEQPDEDDSLEWEMPGSAERAVDGELHVQHRHSEEQPPVEDVLEETPDFLRDTPEQERLWFEQRPPRDFDFNE